MWIPTQIHAQLAKYFADYPARSLEPVYVPQEPLQQGRREAHEEFPTELTRLALVWHVPELTHPDVPALDLLSTILGDGRSSRLYRKVREEAGPCLWNIRLFLYAGRSGGAWDRRDP